MVKGWTGSCLLYANGEDRKPYSFNARQKVIIADESMGNKRFIAVGLAGKTGRWRALPGESGGLAFQQAENGELSTQSCGNWKKDRHRKLHIQFRARRAVPVMESMQSVPGWQWEPRLQGSIQVTGVFENQFKGVCRRLWRRWCYCLGLKCFPKAHVLKAWFLAHGTFGRR